jgi:excisionase family DNA binding protein
MSLLDVQRRLITIDQAAERLGLSRRTVERKIEQGVIPALQLGGRGTAIRIDERELAGWLAEHRTPTSGGSFAPSPRPTPTERGDGPGLVGGRGNPSPQPGAKEGQHG